MVMVGIRALRSAWRTTILDPPRPLARAVRMKSWESTSSIDDRVTRVTRPMIELHKTSAGRVRCARALLNAGPSPARRLSTTYDPVTDGGAAIWAPNLPGPGARLSAA